MPESADFSLRGIERALCAKGVKPTPNRILVMRELARAPRPVSLADLEALLGYTVDKASIFRVLEAFAADDVVHQIDDGSRSAKYELCPGEGGHAIADLHSHFHCERCGRTVCIDAPVPLIALPDGFALHSVNYMAKGLCPQCGRKP